MSSQNATLRPAAIWDRLAQTADGLAALKVAEVLHQQGFEAYLAGGAVRDLLCGFQPHDFDLATNATPDQVESAFAGRAKTVAVGKQFGIIVVIQDEQQIEVARFRADGMYQDGRHPTSIAFSSAEEDAKRRDYTANALFFDLRTRRVIDYVGGLNDIELRVLRAVGEPLERFREDRLRLLRAIRLSCQLDFGIEPRTWKAICEISQKGSEDESSDSSNRSSALIGVSRERVRDEIEKLFLSQFPGRGLEMMVASGLSRAVLGESVTSPNWAFADPKRQDAWTALTASGLSDEKKTQLAWVIWTWGARDFDLAAFRLAKEKTRGILQRLRWLDEAAERARQALPQQDDWWAWHLSDEAGEDGVHLVHWLMGKEPAGVYIANWVRQLGETMGLEPGQRPTPLLSGHELMALGLKSGPGLRNCQQTLVLHQLLLRIRSVEQARSWVATTAHEFNRS